MPYRAGPANGESGHDLCSAPSTLVTMVGSDRRRSFEIRTYGCQMNMHDSERLAGLLEEAGYAAGRRRGS